MNIVDGPSDRTKVVPSFGTYGGGIEGARKLSDAEVERIGFPADDFIGVTINWKEFDKATGR